MKSTQLKGFLQPVTLFVLSIFIFSSCKKDFPPRPNKQVVLVAGYESNGEVNVAKCWIDGQELVLSDGNYEAKANAVSASGNNVYVAGVDNNQAVYWENNIEIKLPVTSSFSTANAIYISGNNIYIAGTDGPQAVYWKNGKEIALPGTGFSKANSIFVVKNDVYVAGIDRDGMSIYAAYWKNGIEKILGQANSGAGLTSAQSIFVSGTDVHVVGYFAGGATTFPVYWKNGTSTHLNLPLDSYQNIPGSVFVSDNNVYIAASTRYANPKAPDAIYWKNGEIFILSGNASATAVYVSGKDIYVAGTKETSAAYWKNGTEVKLTDGTQYAFATSIFVSK